MEIYNYWNNFQVRLFNPYAAVMTKEKIELYFFLGTQILLSKYNGSLL